jgi:hypothetical protein
MCSSVLCRQYFGDQVGFYLAYLNALTCWLLAPAAASSFLMWALGAAGNNRTGKLEQHVMFTACAFDSQQTLARQPLAAAADGQTDAQHCWQVPGRICCGTQWSMRQSKHYCSSLVRVFSQRNQVHLQVTDGGVVCLLCCALLHRPVEPPDPHHRRHPAALVSSRRQTVAPTPSPTQTAMEHQQQPTTNTPSEQHQYFWPYFWS